mmetsp:Transcript_26344/g.30147  ORF Transcript_26344/g.30147 Transcript_26344/m.30147 type:complete len:660 (+) Transcript_26344:1-1980(+)
MGGQSTGSFSKKGRFVGHVAIVPSLQAPGFIKAETSAGETWPDVSSCTGLEWNVSSHTEYSGFRVSFGKNRPPDAFPFTYGYKANLKIPSEEEEAVRMPFTDFTDKWDAATGDAVVTCQEDAQYCPDEETLRDLFSIAIWGEGSEGNVDLDIHSIQAYGCSGNNDETTTDYNANEQEEEDSIRISSVKEETSSNNEILIEDFANPTNEWKALNDPVMGGQSTSSVAIENGVAEFRGRVEIVPFLQAPGFVTMVTGGYRSKAAKFPDVSSCNGIKVILRSTKSVEDYTGYRISFGRHRVPGGRFATGYKAPAWTDVPTTDFGELVFPFDTFSAKWDDASGSITVPCSSQNPQYCPDKKNLQNMKTMSFWGEGVAGDVALQIKSIHAVGCTSIKSSSSTTATTAPEEEETEELLKDMQTTTSSKYFATTLPAIATTTAEYKVKNSNTNDEIIIEDFSTPLHQWITKNDPVMGGKSTSSVTIQDGIAEFEGLVRIVPFLGAPGFVTMVTEAKFPDVSSCRALKLVLRSRTAYAGYRISFGRVHLPNGHHASGYKAPAWTHVPNNEEFGTLLFPFQTFSSSWNDATGDIEEPCSSNPEYCPTPKSLQNMQTISLWGEGVTGEVSLEIKSISAVGCSSNAENQIKKDEQQQIISRRRTSNYLRK